MVFDGNSTTSLSEPLSSQFSNVSFNLVIDIFNLNLEGSTKFSDTREKFKILIIFENMTFGHCLNFILQWDYNDGLKTDFITRYSLVPP